MSLGEATRFEHAHALSGREAALRGAFETALAGFAANPSRYEAELWESDDVLTTAIGRPFTAWYEHLVASGRFAEARDACERVRPILGAGFMAKPRPRIRSLVEALVSMAPNVFERDLSSMFGLHAFRSDAALPYGAGRFESICVALPVPLFSSEPMWIVFARVTGTSAVRVFTLEWFAEEMRARPAAWASHSYLGPREYGTDLFVSAPPLAGLGAGSPYLPLFMVYIGLKLEASAPRAPGAHVPASFPPSLLRAPVPSLAPRSWPPPPGGPPRSNTARILAWIVLALVAAGALGGYLWLRR